MWYVYIISCSDNSLYTGITTDIPRRLDEHNSGKGGRYTRIRMPVKLLHKENYPSRSKALKREIQIKTFSKKEKLVLINSAPFRNALIA
jgi:putative endonuclease